MFRSVRLYSLLREKNNENIKTVLVEKVTVDIGQNINLED